MKAVRNSRFISSGAYRQRRCPVLSFCIKGIPLNVQGLSRVLLLLNPAVIKDEYPGEQNMLEWKPDSSGFLCYYRIFNGLSGDDFQKFPRYVFDISNGAVYITELSDSDIGKAEDLFYFTTSGNVLSLAYLELFNGQTGTLTADRSLDVPLIAEVMFGRDENEDMYFADLDGL